MSIRRFAVRGHCKLIFYQINQIFQKLDDFAIKSIVLYKNTADKDSRYKNLAPSSNQKNIM